MTREQLEHLIRAAAVIADDRLILIQNENTRGAKGLCLEVNDLLVSKIIAGRDKDFDFLREAARSRLAERAILVDRLATVEAEPEVLQSAQAAIERIFRE